MNRETQTDPTHVKLARAIQALQQTRLKLEATEAAQHEPIAIIGMGCHYPGGADSPERFWQNLLAGVDSIRELPDHRVTDMFGEQSDALAFKLPTTPTTAAATPAKSGGPLPSLLSPTAATSKEPALTPAAEASLPPLPPDVPSTAAGSTGAAATPARAPAAPASSAAPKPVNATTGAPLPAPSSGG